MYPVYPYPYYPQVSPFRTPPPLDPPAEVDDESQPAPAGYTRMHRPQRGLALGGMSALAPLYAFSVTAGIVSETSSDRWLLVPVLGPAIDILTRKRCARSDGYGSTCSEDLGIRSILALDFIGQASGAVMLAFAYLAPRQVFVRNDLASAPRRSLPLLLVPGPVGSGTGLSAAGSFLTPPHRARSRWTRGAIEDVREVSEPGPIDGSELGLGHAEAPVPAAGPRRVHAGPGAEAQQILQGQNRRTRC